MRGDLTGMGKKKIFFIIGLVDVWKTKRLQLFPSLHPGPLQCDAAAPAIIKMQPVSPVLGSDLAL